MKSYFVAGIFPILLTVLNIDLASGQPYPNKPIRVVTTDPGGSGDFYARLISNGISGSLGQPMVVDNRPPIAAEERAAQAVPDGYTLLSQSSGTWIRPLLIKTPYKMSDFAPIINLAQSPSFIAVHPSVPINSVKELIEYAKAKPGELNYAASAKGSAAHLGGELFKSMTGVNITGVGYKSAGPALTGVVSGEVQLMFATVSSGMGQVKAGRLKALAVTSSEPSALAPGLPTVAASVPGYEWVTYFIMFAPTKTPTAIITRLNQEIARLLQHPDIKEQIFNTGSTVVGGSPEQLAAKMNSEMARIGKVIKDADIHAE